MSPATRGVASPRSFESLIQGRIDQAIEAIDKDLAKKTKPELARDTPVEVTEFEMKKPASSKDKSTQPYVAKIKTADGKEGWMRMANLIRE